MDLLRGGNRSINWRGREGDYRLSDTARADITQMLAQVRNPTRTTQGYQSRYQSLLERGATKDWQQRDAARRERAGQLGLGGSSFDVEREAVLDRERGESMATAPLLAMEKAEDMAGRQLAQKLSIINALQQIRTQTPWAAGIGVREAALQTADDARKRAAWGGLLGMGSDFVVGAGLGADAGLNWWESGLASSISPDLFAVLLERGSGGDKVPLAQ